MSKNPWSVYVDASGDEGFRFDKNSSRFMVLSLIMTESPGRLSKLLARLRKDLNLAPMQRGKGSHPRRYEFKYGNKRMTRRIRTEFFQRMFDQDFTLQYFVVNKTAVRSLSLQSNAEVFRGAIWRLPLECGWGFVSDAALVHDYPALSEWSVLGGDEDYWLGQLNVPPNQNKIARIFHQHASQHDILQIADMYAGVRRAHFEHGITTYDKYVEPHIAQEYHYSAGELHE